MASQPQLQALLVQKLGNNNVYFQPPASVKLNYDCIVYSLSNIKTMKADDDLYSATNRYTVKYIHRNPSTSVTNELLKIRYCSFDRRYVSDNLYHDIFNLYF